MLNAFNDRAPSASLSIHVCLGYCAMLLLAMYSCTSSIRRGAGVVGVIGGLDARAGIKRALLRQRKEGRDYTGRTASKW